MYSGRQGQVWQEARDAVYGHAIHGARSQWHPHKPGHQAWDTSDQVLHAAAPRGVALFARCESATRLRSEQPLTVKSRTFFIVT